MSVLVETITFPTDIIEQEWATVRIYAYKNDLHAALVFPREREIGEDAAIRLENIALKYFKEKKADEHRVQ